MRKEGKEKGSRALKSILLKMAPAGVKGIALFLVEYKKLITKDFKAT